MGSHWGFMFRTLMSSKLVIGAFAVGLLGAAGGSAAYAAARVSDSKYTGTVDGYSFQYYAGIDNGSNIADSDIQTTDESNAPVGQMGAAAHLYAADTSLCEVSGWQYNGNDFWAFSALTNGSYCGSGYYYSSGFVRAYNGDGYTTYQTDSTPQLPFS